MKHKHGRINGTTGKEDALLILNVALFLDAFDAIQSPFLSKRAPG